MQVPEDEILRGDISKLKGDISKLKVKKDAIIYGDMSKWIFKDMKEDEEDEEKISLIEKIKDFWSDIDVPFLVLGALTFFAWASFVMSIVTLIFLCASHI